MHRSVLWVVICQVMCDEQMGPFYKDHHDEAGSLE